MLLAALSLPPLSSPAAPLHELLSSPCAHVHLSTHTLGRLSPSRRPLDALRSAVGLTLALRLSRCGVRIGHDAGGRPRVEAAGGEPLLREDVSIAHHGSWVMAAAAVAARVGVDVLRVDSAPATVRERAHLAAYLAPSECAALEALVGASAPCHARAFAALWALKEACAKALGSEGMSARSFSELALGPPCLAALMAWAPAGEGPLEITLAPHPSGSAWRARAWMIDAEHVAAAALLVGGEGGEAQLLWPPAAVQVVTLEELIACGGERLSPLRV